MNTTEYWQECLANAAEECGMTATPEQLKSLAEAAESAHENYSMAFYSPPASDRVADIEQEHKRKYRELERDFDAYQSKAERAVGKALNQHDDANIGIGRDGEVVRFGGRTEVIQS